MRVCILIILGLIVGCVAQDGDSAIYYDGRVEVDNQSEYTIEIIYYYGGLHVTMYLDPGDIVKVNAEEDTYMICSYYDFLFDDWYAYEFYHVINSQLELIWIIY